MKNKFEWPQEYFDLHDFMSPIYNCLRENYKRPVHEKLELTKAIFANFCIGLRIFSGLSLEEIAKSQNTTVEKLEKFESGNCKGVYREIVPFVVACNGHNEFQIFLNSLAIFMSKSPNKQFFESPKEWARSPHLLFPIENPRVLASKERDFETEPIN